MHSVQTTDRRNTRCVVVVGRLHLSHETTPCCRQVYVTDAWVDTGGRESGSGGDLGFDAGGVVVFAGPEGAGFVERVPLSHHAHFRLLHSFPCWTARSEFWTAMRKLVRLQS